MAEQIVKTEYSEVMQKSYIDYSMSVITARCQRRIKAGTAACFVCNGSVGLKL